MSLLTLYNDKQTTLAPPANQQTYEQYVFKMEQSGTNDLVQMDIVDPTFRPPLVQNSYIAQQFAQGVSANQL